MGPLERAPPSFAIDNRQFAMALYILQSQLRGGIADVFLKQALDDNGDLVNDDQLYEDCYAFAARQIDAVLEAKGVELPLEEPFPATVVNAAQMKVLETMWSRRGRTTEENNPWMKPAKEAMKLLEEWAENPGTSGAGGVSWGSDELIDL